MAIDVIVLGTWEQKENKPGKTGIKAHLREQGTHKERNTFREQGNTRKTLLGTREHEPPGRPLLSVL